jgi:hypothetical protein
MQQILYIVKLALQLALQHRLPHEWNVLALHFEHCDVT